MKKKKRIIIFEESKTTFNTADSLESYKIINIEFLAVLSPNLFEFKIR